MLFEQTEYGFKWGPVNISRVCDDEKRGCVTLVLTTPKYQLALGDQIQIYVTRTGKVGISNKRGEWMPPTGNGESKTPRKVKNDRINALEVELRKCVTMMDGECTMKDGSNANTWDAHKLLGDYDGKET